MKMHSNPIAARTQGSGCSDALWGGEWDNEPVRTHQSLEYVPSIRNLRSATEKVSLPGYSDSAL